METLLIVLAASAIGAAVIYLVTKKALEAAKRAAGEANLYLAKLETENARLKNELDKVEKMLNDEKNTISRQEKAYFETSMRLRTVQTEKIQTEERLREAKEHWQQQIQKSDILKDELDRQRYKHAATTEELRSLKEKLATQKAEIEQLGEKFEHAFGVLAQKILDDKSKKFSDEQEKNMKNLLEPLQKDIANFKEEIGLKHKQESEERISLREAVKHITGLNKTLSEQAERLTETLRLQVKQQGDWGESILEAILEHSGLQKGLQYFTQQSSRNEEGRNIRPDVVVKYPDDRKIIIDSKVSLVNYYDLCGCTPEEEEGHKNLMICSFRSHIDSLASKNYGDIQDALDFVIMFVPVEPAYIAAMHCDPALWQYAYKKRILLISPANLVATLKLVEDMWRKDAIDKNAQAIAQKAGKIYDKLESFVINFERVGEQLQKASGTWEEARKQLVSGRGNLVRQAAQMKQLHIDNKKDIAREIEQEALVNGGFFEEDVL